MSASRIAFDRAPVAARPSIAFDRSVRRIDQDGHLHIEVCVLSAACVCDYIGSELPDGREKGFDPNKIYRLYRTPESLEKAASTFVRKPVLFVHKPVNAKDHPHSIVVGAVGDDVRFDAPSLLGSFTVWDGAAIDAIDQDRGSVSCGYHWTVEKTPGRAPDGTPYDGIIIVEAFNHLALVDEPRVKTAIIGDRASILQSKGLLTMAGTSALSRQGLLAASILSANVKLAQDAKIDLNRILRGVTSQNWAERRPTIRAALARGLKGKMAQDADVSDLDEVLDKIEDASEALSDAIEDVQEGAPADPNADVSADETDEEKLKAAGLSDDEIAAVMKLRAGNGGEAAADAEGGEGGERNDEPKVSKTAMDAAIALATKKAVEEGEARAVARVNSLHAAKRAVEPIVGEVIGMDSATEVYRFALEQEGYALKGIDPAAFEPLFTQHAKNRAAAAASPGLRTIAHDAAQTASLFQRVPGLQNIKFG